MADGCSAMLARSWSPDDRSQSRTGQLKISGVNRFRSLCKCVGIEVCIAVVRCARCSCQDLVKEKRSVRDLGDVGSSLFEAHSPICYSRRTSTSKSQP